MFFDAALYRNRCVKQHLKDKTSMSHKAENLLPMNALSKLNKIKKNSLHPSEKKRKDKSLPCSRLHCLDSRCFSV